MTKTVCTAPIGMSIASIPSDIIMNLVEIDNEFTCFLFNVKLSHRITRGRTLALPTFGITNAQGNVVCFGIAALPVLRGALRRYNAQGDLAKELLA